MSQLRLFVAVSEADATRLLDEMGTLFEDDGYPVATSEIDEKAGRWEASVYVPAEDEEGAMERLTALVAEHLPNAAVEREPLPDIDWVSHSLKGLKPVRAGRFVVHGAHDRPRVRPCDRAIEIEAGQAFGTGHHGTTAGCLEMIETVIRRRPPRRVLDLGTGSGVLAIGVKRLQQSAEVLATDIDPVATAVARRNARLNGVVAGLAMETAVGFQSTVFKRHGPFDLIIANILARPLMHMAPDIRRHLVPGGTVVLSGILAEQRWKVLSAFNAVGLAHAETLWREGWVTLRLQS